MNVGRCYMIRRLCRPRQQPNRTSRQVRPSGWPAYYFLIRGLSFVFQCSYSELRKKKKKKKMYTCRKTMPTSGIRMGIYGTVLFYSYMSSSMARIF